MVSRSILAAGLLLLAPLTALAQSPPAGGQPGAQAQQMSPQQFNQMVSYALGRSVAEDCKLGGVQLDLRALQTGINEVQADKDPQFSEAQMNQAMQNFAMRIQQQTAANNKQEGDRFLASNAQQPGVQTTPSGLQYKILKEGDGASPTDQSLVTCHYRGTFINGEEFDSSYGGEPARFPVRGVIAGWTEALKLMQVGDKWQLFVPSDLAYGEAGRPGIGPNETLLFEIELLDVSAMQQGQLPTP